jgi:hypothetical protein
MRSVLAGLIVTIATVKVVEPTSWVEGIKHQSVYLGTAAAFGSIYAVVETGKRICQLSRLSSRVENEFSLLDDLCFSALKRSWNQLKQSTISHPYDSWNENRSLLSQIQTTTTEDHQLIAFLQRRWLAKSTGFFHSVIDWVCPSYGVLMQVHPETVSSYARLPSLGASPTYLCRMDAWKKELPHPIDFPLLLTRPASLNPYFSLFPKQILDVTAIFPENSALWMETWEKYRDKITDQSMICIQTLRQGDLGGIRILPLPGQNVEKDAEFLLDWVSHLGLTASRIDLDRGLLPITPNPTGMLLNKHTALKKIDLPQHPQKRLMLAGVKKAIEGFLAEISDVELSSSTRSSIEALAFSRIQQEIEKLDAERPFFEVAAHVEQIYENLAELLAIYQPFSDFGPHYRTLLVSIPSSLQVSCGLHTSGMTSLAGIFKRVKDVSQREKPVILYGENTYFEAILMSEQIGQALPFETSTQNEWKEVDLVLAQFNPPLKRIDMNHTEYKVEHIVESLRQIFSSGRKKPLTVAIDCTIDFIDSPRIGALLKTFENEITAGLLNVICYRSGLKFDLFGMDNYCGAPVYMVHAKKPHWAPFESLMTDPVLLADDLSLNWFCLAYKYCAKELDEYRRQIFDNTRKLLQTLPPGLFHGEHYRVVPFAAEAEPAFLDIKITGAFHEVRAAALLGGTLYLKCMENGHPIFYRPSLGFYHPNFTMLFGKECSTIRLTLGLDPSQIDVLAECFKTIHSLN